mmetsp:Transcript_19076/g.26665  ORF Transcript_19076/g.26665 Transcript_19076/m.26665 type:complete len:105 (-) Transcript_19076:445-759(-)
MGDHSETIQIEYDPDQISYEQLLDKMFDEHPGYMSKPYSMQYRSGIWFQNEEQKSAAENKIRQIEEETGRKVFTHVAPLEDFYLAEEYHQKFQEKNARKIYGLF